MYIGRSDAEIRDDSLVSLHSTVQKSLNAMCNGKMLYVGEQRRLLVKLLESVEDAMFGDVVYFQSMPDYAMLNRRYLRILEGKF
jgi:hypothetical protein